MLMALALCLTLLPVSPAWAKEADAQTPPAVEKAADPANGEEQQENQPAAPKQENQSAEQEEQQEDSAAKQAVAAVQAMIGELPSLGELKGMDSDTLNEAYMAVQSAYDAYEALSEEQQAQVTGADRFEGLFGWFNSQVATLADEVTGIWLDEVDLKTGEMTQGKQNWTATPLGDSDGNLTLTGGNMYVVGENQEVTIDGDLTMAGNSQNYLILFNGAKLIINGALILERNGLNICSHTESQRLDTIGQITINNSKEPSGAAIRSSTVDARTLNLWGGKLTAKGGEYGAVSNVYLNRNDRPLKATLGGELLSPADWAFTPVNSPANKNLVIKWCEHDTNIGYTPSGNTQHRKTCEDCGFAWAAEDCDFTGVKGYRTDGSKHYASCACGNYDPNGEAHDWKGSVPTDGNKKHSLGCFVCLYASGEPEEHRWKSDGSCEACEFTPIATDKAENGNLYDDIGDAIKSGVKELWLVSYEKDPTTDKYTNTLRKNLEIGEGVTLTLHMNGVKLEGIAGSPALTVSGGTLTVQGEADLVSPDITGGTTEFSAAPAIKVTSGSLIFEDAVTATGSKSSSAVASAIEVSGGTVTFMGNVKATGGYNSSGLRSEDKQVPAIKATGGTLDFQAGLDLNGGLYLAKADILKNKLTQGTFTAKANVSRINHGSGQAAYRLLGNDCAFYKYADGKQGDLVSASYSTISEDVTIGQHEHNYQPVENKTYYQCGCGVSCSHTNGYTDGKCSVCGYPCPHTDGVDHDGTCLTCHAQMAVKSETGGTVTYGTDFKAAMNAAENGTKITLLADVSILGRTGISGDNTTVTLDLNEHKITSGWLDVGGKDTNGTYTACTLKIIGKGSYEPPMYGGIITVNMKATLDLSEWEGGTISSINISDNSNYEATTREPAVIVGSKAGTIGKLAFGNNQLPKITKTKLSGGSFNEIWVAGFGPVKLGELLADGYAYQYTDGVDRFVEYTKTLQGESIYNVKVVKCLHPNMKPGEDGVATCEYCGKSGKFVASVDGNLYTDMDEAITYWLANGGTLKLYADYTAATEKATWTIVSGEHSIDLNGHRMSVQDDSAFKPTNNMHLTVTDGTERGQITNILLDGSQRGSFTLESGYVCNLEMTGGAVVTLKGGSVDNLDVQNCSENTNLSIQGGSLGKLNIEDWAEGMHVSATGGSLGGYTLPSGKILADVLDHQYYAEGTSLDKGVDAA